MPGHVLPPGTGRGRCWDGVDTGGSCVVAGVERVQVERRLLQGPLGDPHGRAARDGSVAGARVVGTGFVGGAGVGGAGVGGGWEEERQCCVRQSDGKETEERGWQWQTARPGKNRRGVGRVQRV